MRMKPPVKTRPKPKPEQLELGAGPRTTLADYVDAEVRFIGAVATMRKRAELAELEAYEAREAANEQRRPGVYRPGDVVVFTAKYLWSAQAGLQAADVVTEWTVQECTCELCLLGQHVCTTQWLADRDGWRHLARAHIRHRGHWTDDCPMGLQPLVSIPRLGNVRARLRGDR